MNDLLKTIFGGYDVQFNYDNGKEVRIYYGKLEYVAFKVSETMSDSQIISMANRYRKNVLNVIGIIMWFRSGWDIGKKINTYLEALFECEVGFDVYFTDKIYIKCFDTTMEVNTHDIKAAYDQPVVSSFISFAEKKLKKIQALQKSMAKSVETQFHEQITEKFSEVILHSPAWISFENNIKDLYVLFEEFREYMDKYGFNYRIDNFELMSAVYITDTLDLSTYHATVAEKARRLTGRNASFSIRKGKVEELLFNTKRMKEVKRSLDMVWKVVYDVHCLFKNLSSKNICFRIADDGKLWVHSYAECAEVHLTNDIYNFAAITARNATAAKERAVNDEKLLHFIASHDVGCLRQCMKLYGDISPYNLSVIYSCRGCKDEKESPRYDNIPNVLNRLKKLGIVESWHISGNDLYSAEFKENYILKYECVEAKETIDKVNAYTFCEAVKLLSVKNIKKMFNDKEKVFDGTKDILCLMDDKDFCETYSKEITIALPYMDKKYIPLLDLKTRNSSAPEVMGKLYSEVKDFLKGMKS